MAFDEPTDEAEPADETEPADGTEPAPEQDLIKALEDELARMQAGVQAEIERMESPAEVPTLEEAEDELPDSAVDEAEPSEPAFNEQASPQYTVSGPAPPDLLVDLESKPTYADDRPFAQQPLTDATHGDLSKRPGQTRRRRRSPAGRALVVAGVIVLVIVGGVLDAQKNESEKIEKTAQYDRLSSRIAVLQDRSVALQHQDRLANNAALKTVIGKLMGTVRGDPSPKEIAALLPAIKHTRNLIAKQSKNSASLTRLWDKATRLDISEAHTTYGGQQKKLAELDLQMGANLSEFFAKLRMLATRWTTLSAADKLELRQEISDVTAKGDELRLRADRLQRASQQYYEENFE
jgi:hypothetical protein